MKNLTQLIKFSNKTLLRLHCIQQVVFIDPQSHKKHKGKEKIFWHITTRENKQNKTREFDSQRACRINWIKQIIINHTHPEIKAFIIKRNGQSVFICGYITMTLQLFCKSVWVEGEYGAEYKVNYEEGIYYIISISFFVDIFIISFIYVETCH